MPFKRQQATSQFITNINENSKLISNLVVDLSKRTRTRKPIPQDKEELPLLSSESNHLKPLDPDKAKQLQPPEDQSQTTLRRKVIGQPRTFFIRASQDLRNQDERDTRSLQHQLPPRPALLSNEHFEQPEKTQDSLRQTGEIKPKKPMSQMNFMKERSESVAQRGRGGRQRETVSERMEVQRKRVARQNYEGFLIQVSQEAFPLKLLDLSLPDESSDTQVLLLFFRTILQCFGFRLEEPWLKKYKNCLVFGSGDIRIVRYYNDKVYVGFMRDTKKEGRGVQWHSHSYFIGNWVQGKRQGRGFEVNLETGYKYEGMWKGGIKHGYGLEKTQESLYKGQFMFGYKHGQGQQSFRDGRIIRGNFVNGLLHGPGEIINRNQHLRGDFYKGKLVQSQTQQRKSVELIAKEKGRPGRNEPGFLSNARRRQEQQQVVRTTPPEEHRKFKKVQPQNIDWGSAQRQEEYSFPQITKYNRPYDQSLQEPQKPKLPSQIDSAPYKFNSRLPVKNNYNNVSILDRSQGDSFLQQRRKPFRGQSDTHNFQESFQNETSKYLQESRVQASRRPNPNRRLMQIYYPKTTQTAWKRGGEDPLPKKVWRPVGKNFQK